MFKYFLKSNTARIQLWIAIFIFACFLLSPGLQSIAQTDEAPGTPPITPEMVEAGLSQAEANDSLSDEHKTALIAILQHNLEISRVSQEWDNQAAQYQRNIEEAPSLLEELQQTMSVPPAEIEIEIPEDVTMSQIDGIVSRYETELSTAIALRNELEAEPTRRANRRRQIPELLSSARNRLENLAQTELVVEADDPPELAQAKQQQNLLRRQALENEIRALEKEMTSYDARSQILILRTDLAIRNVSRLESAAERAREKLSAQRQILAQRAAQEAREMQLEAAGADPLVREMLEVIAQDNAELVARRIGTEGLVHKIEAVTQEEQRINRDRIRIEGEKLSLSEKIETIGLNNATGLLLRKQKSYLPNVRQLRRNQRERQEQITNIQIEQIQYREIRMELANIDAAVNTILTETSLVLDDEENENLRTLLREVLQTQRNSLDALLEDYSRYIELLILLDTREKELITLVNEFSNFIDERVLWIRSGTPLNLEHALNTLAALQWFTNREQLQNIAFSWYMDIYEYPYLYASIILLIGMWFAMRRRIRQAILEDSKRAANPRCIAYTYTLRTFIETLLLSMPLPTIFAFLSWRCTVMSYGEDLVRSFSPGFLSLTFLLLTFNTFRHILRTGGLGITHFGWLERSALQVRKIMRWFLAITMPFVFVIEVMEWTNNEEWKEALGRNALMVMMLLLAGLAWKALHPTRGPVQQILEHRLLEGQTRIRKLWFFLGIATPTGLAVAAGMGYYYSAWTITFELYVGASLLFGFLLAYGMIMRWTLLAHRALRIDQAKKRLAALKAKAQEDSGDIESTSEAVEIEEETLDLQKVDEQSQRLIKGLMGVSLIIIAWFIWSDQLNAINILDRVTLWPAATVTTETTTAPDGSEILTITEFARDVTLANLFMAFLIITLTFLATRNLPGLLEIALLQRMELASGERYAIVTIARYIITAIGIVMVFNAVEIGWTNVQWLVAALSVGLGFGLQEIFANFVSGIILLFERPIRVGDVVTIGGTSGTVSKIRIRATTITDFDRKELVVPNREFVTGQLINWTLSDATLRIIIPIGIAYGSDTELALKLLKQAADEHPLVMQDPGPSVYFMSFGDNSLDFELRVFSPSIDHLLKIRHDLNIQIDKLFRDNRIEISFPQHDVHIRSIQDHLTIHSKVSSHAVKVEDDGTATA